MLVRLLKSRPRLSSRGIVRAITVLSGHSVPCSPKRRYLSDRAIAVTFVVRIRPAGSASGTLAEGVLDRDLAEAQAVRDIGAVGRVHQADRLAQFARLIQPRDGRSLHIEHLCVLVAARAAAGVRATRIQRHAVIRRRVERYQRVRRTAERVTAGLAGLVVVADPARRLRRIGDPGSGRRLLDAVRPADPSPLYLCLAAFAPVVVAMRDRP